MKNGFLLSTLLILFTINLLSQSAKDNMIKYYEEQNYSKAAEYAAETMNKNPDDFNLALLAGDIYYSLTEFEQALKYYMMADEIDGSEPPAEWRIGVTKSQLGMHQEALNLLNELANDEKEDINVQLALGEALINADSIARAELIITRVKTMAPDNPKSYIALGDLNFARRVYELSKQNYEKALSIDEDLLLARIKLATAYYWLAVRESDADLSNELFAKSLKEWKVVTQKDPTNSNAYFWVGKINFFARLYKDAALALYEYAKLKPDGKLGRWYLAQSLYEVGKCDSAAPHLEYVSKNIDSVKVKSKLLLARCYYDNKEYDKSQAVFAQIKADTTLDFIDMQRYGNSAWLVGDTVNAIAINKETVFSFPDQACGLMDRFGRLLIFLKKYDDAIEILKKRLETEACIDSTVPRTNYFIGVSHFQSERPDSALPYLQKSVELDSTYLSAWLNLADVHVALGGIEKGMNLFEKVIEMGAPDTASNKNDLINAFNKLCQLYYEANNDSKVVKTADLWAKTLPDLPYPYLWKAYAYFRLQDKDSACTNLRKVRGLDPDNKNAIDLIKQHCTE